MLPELDLAPEDDADILAQCYRIARERARAVRRAQEESAGSAPQPTNAVQEEEDAAAP